MEKVKLVIWDLDDTFWNGTLSDGQINPIETNISLIKTLTDRGIVNSICSKNDYQKVKEKLMEMGVWEYFVFPSIDWTPKGSRIKEIIEDMNLRPINVLFLDDNINNLEEAKYILPDLEIALPEFIPSILNKNEFQGKDDSSHSRLMQYKILEEKKEEKRNFTSNEEFLYQSDIKVEMIEDSEEYDRIYEMIHRNNQLNFTKDRISMDQVKILFSDNKVRSGIVHVKDKYGDHGIVGCYAVKDAKCVQFVFSCRIMGMGVEQYVYSMLGYPEIQIIGEVAGTLQKNKEILWINQQSNTNNKEFAQMYDYNIQTPRLIVYGHCPLRPVWGYLEPKLSNAKFAMILPEPPVSNLGVLFRESKEYCDELIDNVGTFDAKYTFDENIRNGEADYLLITLTNEMMFLKFEEKNGGHRFYSSAKLLDDELKWGLKEKYDVSKITYEDIYFELTTICKKISPNTKILLQTVSEVEFSSKGKDKNYFDRIELNKIAHRLEKENRNLVLIDINKYITSEADFFEPAAFHYNRAIGFAVASEILEVMGINNFKLKSEEKENIPDNAIYGSWKKGEYNLSYCLYIKNAKLYFKLIDFKGYVQYLTYKNRLFLAKTERSKNEYYVININKPGWYMIRCMIETEDGEKYDFWSKKINYSPFNYVRYLDKNEENYDYAVGTLNHFYRDNENDYNYYSRQVSQLSELTAMGVNIAEYFEKKQINEISVFFANKLILNTLMPSLLRSGIKLKYVFTSDEIHEFSYDFGIRKINIKNLNDSIPLSNLDTILMCSKYFQTPEYAKVKSTGVNCIGLDYVISYLLTQKWLSHWKSRSNCPITLACRSGFLDDRFGYKREARTVDEKSIVSVTIGQANKYIKQKEFTKVSKYIKESNHEVLLNTLICPEYEVKNGIKYLKDNTNTYFTVENGFRVTVGQPKSYIGTIYLCGDLRMLGIGNRNEETIASYLQNMIELPYRVVNYSNMWTIDQWSQQLKLLDQTEFESNDIVVLLIDNNIDKYENQYLHWINWDAMVDDEEVAKTDTYSLFYRADRPEYFLLKNAYTKECNHDIAEMIRDTIYKNIKLF